MVVTPNYLCFDYIILKKGKELWRYKHHCFILSSPLLSFNGLFASYNNSTRKCIYYVLARKKAAHKTKHMSCPVLSCCVHIPSHSFQFCHSCHQLLLLEPLFPSTLPSPFYNLASHYWYRNDVKMILPSFHWAIHIGWHGRNSSTRSVGGTSATQTPCELHSILRINPTIEPFPTVHQPYNWTFPNCNISLIMDQSTNKTTNEWLLQVAYGKICSTLGALLFAWQKNTIVWVVRKARTKYCWQILFVLKFSVCHDLPT